MKVYYLTVDYGDGSNGVEFYRSEQNARSKVDDDSPHWDEAYTGNEGCVGFFDIPDGPNTIRFRD